MSNSSLVSEDYKHPFESNIYYIKLNVCYSLILWDPFDVLEKNWLYSFTSLILHAYIEFYVKK